MTNKFCTYNIFDLLLSLIRMMIHRQVPKLIFHTLNESSIAINFPVIILRFLFLKFIYIYFTMKKTSFNIRIFVLRST